MKILLVVNPISGGVDKNPFLEEASSICKRYAIDFFIHKTTGKDDELKLTKTIKNYIPDRIAAIGGDGTVLLCSKILKDFNIPLGIIPLGSANGMAAELFVEQDPIKAFYDFLISEFTSGLDMLVVNNSYYSIHIGDVGINASIVESYEKDENRGMSTYAKYFIEELKDPKNIKYKLECNGKTIESEALMIAICNARKYGTGIPLNTIGNPMDGKFEIVIIENINLNSLVRAGLSSLDEKFIDSQNGQTIVTKSAKIIFPTEQLLQLDGEVIGKFDKLEIELLPHAVQLILNSNNPLVN